MRQGDNKKTTGLRTSQLRQESLKTSSVLSLRDHGFDFSSSWSRFKLRQAHKIGWYDQQHQPTPRLRRNASMRKKIGKRAGKFAILCIYFRSYLPTSCPPSTHLQVAVSRSQPLAVSSHDPESNKPSMLQESEEIGASCPSSVLKKGKKKRNRRMTG